MRRVTIAAAFAAILLLPLAAQTPSALAATTATPTTTPYGRVIVKYRADSDQLRKQALTAAGRRHLQAQALGARIGIELTAGRDVSDRAQVMFGKGVDSARLAARIAAEKDVEYAVVDARKHIVGVPNDPFYASRPITATTGGPAVGQWYLKPPGTAGTAANTAPAAINVEQAWDIQQLIDGSSVVVADLDTGLRFDHPDLLANVIPGYDMVAPDDGPSGTDFTTANDGSGRDSDASDPGDWVTSTEVANNPSLNGCDVSSSSWHGTQTFGLIGATSGNGIGISSVGRSAVKVMPVRVLGKCGGFDSDIIVGMLWAADAYSDTELATAGLPRNTRPAKVLNMSLGSTGACSSPYIDAVARVNAKNAVVVASAGNSVGHPVGTPANCPGVIAVTGLRHVGDKVGFSDLGAEIAISAPGGNCVNTAATDPCLYPIMTTSNSGTTTPVAGAAGAIYTDAFGTASLGTSFSAPLVTGTVALMLSAKPSMTPAEVKATLQATARPFPTSGGSAGTLACVAPVAGVDQGECYCVTGLCGAGMLDAHAAVAAALGVQARVSVTTTTPTAGQPVVLTSSSVVGSGQSISTYLWTIVSANGTGAAITGANNASTVTVTPTAGGTFTISLTTTDNNGFSSTTTQSVTVAGSSGSGGSGGSSSGGGGGGGALGVGWLALLLTAVLALAGIDRLERRRLARRVSDPARYARRR